MKIANVETIEIATGGAAATFIDATGITGAENIAFSATSGTVKITNLAAGTKIGLGETTNRFEGTMDIALADATGAADAISFTTASVDAATTVALTVAAAVETVNIAASTNAANAQIATFTNTNNAAKNIVLTAGHADDTVALGTLNAATTNVNASALAAKLTVTTAAAGAVTVSANGAVANNITTGAGADVITLAGKLGATDHTINGGDGLDTLNATLSTSNAVTLHNVTNVETLNLAVGADVQASFVDTTNAVLGLNAATAVNITGGDVLSSVATGGTTGVITAKTAAQTIDASGFAGKLELITAAGALNSFMTIKAGALLTDKVTTTVSNATTGAKVAAMSGVETLVVNSTIAETAARIDLTNVTGLTSLEAKFAGTTASQIAVDKLASGVTVKFAGGITDDNLVIDLADKAAADNALSLELTSFSGAGASLNFDAAGVETLNINAKNTAAAGLIDLAGVTATATAGNVAVNVTGAGALTLKALNAQTNVVNASAATGAITLASGDRAATAMTITTGTGNDTVAMRHANDVLNGGLGTDTLTINANLVLGGILVDLSSTTDQVGSFNGNANAAVQVGFENVDLSGITGTFGADITARAAGSTITGTANADQITGGAGADTVVFTAGADVVSLGGGNDIFRITDAQMEANDTTAASTFDGGTGTDTILITVDTVVIADNDFRGFTNFEVLTLANGTNSVVHGTAAVAAGITTINGGTGADTITAGAGAQTIVGGLGADVITGGAGTDTIDLTEEVSSVDKIIYAEEGAANVDTIIGFVTGASKDMIVLDVSELNGGAIVDTTGTVISAATTHTIVEYTVGTALATNTANASILKITTITGINTIAEINTALAAHNITMDGGLTDFANTDGIIIAFYSAANSQMVVGYIEDSGAAAAGVFDGTGTTFVEITKVGMTTAAFTALHADNFDIA